MIRAASADDAPAIAELLGRAHLHATGQPHDEGVDELEERWSGLLAESRAWVWCQDGLVAGVLALRDREVLALCVDPTAQGAGVGAALHDLALEELGEGPAKLHAPAGSDQARVFLGARGWREEPEGSGEYVR